MVETGFARKTIEIDGSALGYAERGVGDAVVCIDGVLGLRPSRAHALMAERSRVLVFDLFDPAVASAGVAASPTRLAQMMGGALAALGIARCSVVGHGAGAAVALSFGLEKPDLVAAILAIAPMLLNDDPGPPLLADAALAAALHAHPERRPDPIAAAGPTWTKRRDTARRISAAGDGDLRRRLPALKPPVLALFGMNDPLAPPEIASRYRTGIADCNLMFVYDAGHAIDLDRPEAVAYIGLEFFERHDLFLVNREDSAAFP